MLTMLAAGLGCSEPDRPRVRDISILFIRGADRSGGFLEAGNDAARTSQLADITDPSTANRNHGWLELAETLRSQGWQVSQLAEPLEPGAPATGGTTGAPIPFESMDLAQFDVLVFGSNNAAYGPAQADAIEAFVRGGGAALFISDANFGGSWPDASNSDQALLDRFGWIMQQDRGTYVLSRTDGDFLVPDHPILAGIESIDGEGVSPIVVPATDLPGVRTTMIVRANPGSQTRNNDGDPGSIRTVGPQDATLAIAYAGAGRIAGHIDRNTFFNLNGAGTSINRFDNRAYAINLFRWLALGDMDLDGDGLVSIDDLHEQTEQPRDVNGDGVIDNQDARTIETTIRRRTDPPRTE